MKEVTKELFEKIVAVFKEGGEISSTSYGGLGNDSSLVEYFGCSILFGFELDGKFYSNFEYFIK